MTRSRKAPSAAALHSPLVSRKFVLGLARRHPLLPKNVATPAGPHARPRYFLAVFSCSVHTHRHDYRPPHPPLRLRAATRPCSRFARVWRDVLSVTIGCMPDTLSRTPYSHPGVHPHLRIAKIDLDCPFEAAARWDHGRGKPSYYSQYAPPHWLRGCLCVWVGGSRIHTEQCSPTARPQRDLDA